jgi:hypothetical protein
MMLNAFQLSFSGRPRPTKNFPITKPSTGKALKYSFCNMGLTNAGLFFFSFLPLTPRWLIYLALSQE